MKYPIDNFHIEVHIALLIIVIISQLGLIFIGLRKNHYLKIDTALEQARKEYRENASKHVCSVCKRKGK